MRGMMAKTSKRMLANWVNSFGPERVTLEFTCGPTNVDETLNDFDHAEAVGRHQIPHWAAVAVAAIPITYASRLVLKWMGTNRLGLKAQIDLDLKRRR
jgi:hypothetical protein